MSGSNPSKRNRWGVRSLVTGQVYPIARDHYAASFLWVNTGATERYEVVERLGDGWVSRPPDYSLVADPQLARAVPATAGDEDEEIVRLAMRLLDPLRGVERPKLGMTGEEVRGVGEGWGSG